MSTPERPSRIEVMNRIRELLGQATLARIRGRKEEALKLAQEALTLDEGNGEAHELVGDLLMDLNRGEQALGSFQRARELMPDRVALEDKMARAALRKAKRLETLARSEALLAGKEGAARRKRSPGYAALLSLIVPGLGQLYNGEVVKGLAMVAAFVLLAPLAMLAVLREVSAAVGVFGGPSGPQMGVGGVLSALSSGEALVVIIPLAGLWIYAIADAALRAGRTMTSDDTGLV